MNPKLDFATLTKLISDNEPKALFSILDDFFYQTKDDEIKKIESFYIPVKVEYKMIREQGLRGILSYEEERIRTSKVISRLVEIRNLIQEYFEAKERAKPHEIGIPNDSIGPLGNSSLNITYTNVTTLNYAGFWHRLLASIIDLAIVYSMFIFTGVIIELIFLQSSTYDDSYIYLIFLLGVIIFWLFYAIFEGSKFQATPGKAILGLKVVDKKNNRINFRQASSRFLGRVLSYFTIGIGYLMIGFTRNKQGLHDLIADTYVLKGDVSGLKRKNKSWMFFGLAFILFMISISIIGEDPYSGPFNPSKINNNNEGGERFYYEGISFILPNDWKVEKKEMQKDAVYSIHSEKNVDAFNSLDIFLYKMELAPFEQIETMINTLKNQPIYKTIRTTNISNITYHGIEGSSLSFNFTLFEDEIYGEIISFNKNEKTIIIIKQTEELEDLINDFNIIENSLSFD